MRITQCEISKSVADFPFREVYGLTSYCDSAAPCIFFGCYSEDDLISILNHNSLAVIVWCGQDSVDYKYWKLINRPNIKHISGNKAKEHVSQFVECHQMPIMSLEPNDVKPVLMGNKIFVYMPKDSEQYHGIDVLNVINTDYEFLIGDGSYTQQEWRSGINDDIYSQCFIGLVLNSYAGGITTVVELGVRGIRCVTNTTDLPHVISWENIKDIERAIEKEAKNIGKVNEKLSIFVKSKMDTKREFLNTEYYGV